MSLKQVYNSPLGGKNRTESTPCGLRKLVYLFLVF